MKEDKIFEVTRYMLIEDFCFVKAKSKVEALRKSKAGEFSRVTHKDSPYKTLVQYDSWTMGEVKKRTKLFAILNDLFVEVEDDE